MGPGPSLSRLTEISVASNLDFMVWPVYYGQTMKKSRVHPPISTLRRKRIRQRTKELRRAIDSIDYMLSGTLRQRTKVCGRPNCRCADDPGARHGPYYEWIRLENRRQVQSVLSEDQAAWVEHAIGNHHEIQELLRLWESETAADILKRHKGD